jgi:dihydropteroate synthase
MGSTWLVGDRELDLSKPVVMGILNVTPDSFSDGGEIGSVGTALERGRRMVEEGAGILDVGGESTRPGADPISREEELKRVLPVVRELAAALPVPVSVDTRHAEVAREALAGGALIVKRPMGHWSFLICVGLLPQ